MTLGLSINTRGDFFRIRGESRTFWYLIRFIFFKADASKEAIISFLGSTPTRANTGRMSRDFEFII